TAVIAGNEIAGNAAPSGGGGLYLNSSSPAISNNTITRNRATTHGGGLYSNSSIATIVNSVVAFNASGMYRTGSGNPTLRHNCTFANTAYDYSGLANPTGTNGNISVDPLFEQPPNSGLDGLWGTSDDNPGDLHLSDGSPCIDSGDPAFVPPPGAELDLDGRPRIWDGNLDSLARIDI